MYHVIYPVSLDLLFKVMVYSNEVHLYTIKVGLFMCCCEPSCESLVIGGAKGVDGGATSTFNGRENSHSKLHFWAKGSGDSLL